MYVRVVRHMMTLSALITKSNYGFVIHAVFYRTEEIDYRVVLSYNFKLNFGQSVSNRRLKALYNTCNSYQCDERRHILMQSIRKECQNCGFYT